MAIVPKRRPEQPVIHRPEIQARKRVRIATATEPTSAQPLAPVSTQVAAEPQPEPYKVGYKNPPLDTRFKPGESGNRKGRPRGAKSLKTIMRELLTAKMTVRTAEGKKRISRIEAMAHKLIEAAFSGNLRALQAMLGFYQAAIGDDAPVTSASGSGAPPPLFDPDEHDRAILSALRDQFTLELEAK